MARIKYWDEASQSWKKVTANASVSDERIAKAVAEYMAENPGSSQNGDGLTDMETPRTCNDCPCAMGCCTYYGGSLCRYTNQINGAAIAALLTTKTEGGEKHGKNYNYA